MKVIFLLDNNQFIDVEPTKLQLRQLAPGQSALGIEVVVPVNNEDGTPKLDENGVAETQPAFRPIINYQVDLSLPPAESPVVASAVAPASAPVAAAAAPAPAPVAKAKKRR